MCIPSISEILIYFFCLLNKDLQGEKNKKNKTRLMFKQNPYIFFFLKN